jgi:D-serine deaminase-like pyridoxal phosphate-dependent protein
MNAPPPSFLHAARSGDPIAAIDTPALVVDLDAMERNLASMAAFATRHGLRLRPHAKTHKCAAIAQRQIALGAVGVCVQKVSEAAALADAGVSDLYVSNEVIDPVKLARVAELVRRGRRISIAVDSAMGVDRLAAALQAARGGASATLVDVFVEIDVGQGRCGVRPGAAGDLARHVGSLGDASGMRFAGLQAYHGHAQHLRSAREREGAIGDAAAAVRSALAALDEVDVPCPLVTGAGTGSFAIEAASGVWGELQCGSYVFMDRDYADNAPQPGAPRFEHALFVKTQVVSRGDDHAVVDAGHKSHAIDSGLPVVWGRDDLGFANGGDEHGIVRRAHDGVELPELGATLWLVPGHCDPTVNLHDVMIGVRGGLASGVVETLLRVDARGCVR